MKIEFKYLVLVLSLVGIILVAREGEKFEHLFEGNLALRTSQQPGPLFCFGQNIVDKGDFQVLALIELYKGRRKLLSDVMPGILYGITDNLSLFVNAPVAIKFKQNGNCSKGLEDIFAQVEYAFYNRDTETCAHQATFVANINLPTGDAHKYPPTGYGAPSFFMGFTANHMAIDWYVWGSSGLWLMTRHHGTKFGNQFLYEGGFGRNLCYRSSQYIVTLLLEFEGIYTRKNCIDGHIDNNSGGNVCYAGPSIWFSTKKFILQLGIEGAFAQRLNGNQNKNNWLFTLDTGWKFNS